MEATMLGRQERWQEDLFVAAPLRDWAWCERFTTNRRADRLSILCAIKFLVSTDTTLQAA